MEKQISAKNIRTKLGEMLPKKITILEKDIDAVAKILIDKGFIEYDSVKEVYIYIP